MSTSPSAIPKVRTYAADLNSARETKNVPVASAAPVATPIPAPQPVVTETKVTQAIPPFHTFSKNESARTAPAVPPTPVVKPAPTNSSLVETQKILTASSNLQATGNLKEDLPAVIITDTKRKRFKLSEAIVTSVQDWWNNKKQTAQQKKIPKYTVPVAERRKGVIQKATAKTGRESSADHTAVLTRIKATKQIPHTAPISSGVVIEPKVAEPLWDSAEPMPVAKPQTEIRNQRVVKRQSSVRETLVPPRATDIAKTNSWETDIQAKANALTEPTPAQKSRIILTGKEFAKIKEAKANVSVPPPSVAKPARVISPMIPTTVERSTVNQTPVAVPTEPIIRPQVVTPTPVPPAPRVIEATPPEAPRTVSAVTPPQPYTRPRIEPIIPTTLPTQTPEVATEQFEAVPPTPPVIPTPTVEPKREERRFAPPREPKRNILEMLTQTNRMVFITLGIFIFVVVSGLGLRSYTSAPAQTTGEVVSTVETAFPGSASVTETNFYKDKTQLSDRLKTQSSEADSLTEITFMSEAGAPLSAADFLTVFGASVPFDFVASMSDIRLGNYRGAPWILFTTSDKNTALGGMLAWEATMGSNLAPIFSNEEATSYARFTDSIINNIDVRIMKNSNGTEEIVYGFVGYDTLLITSNTTAFLNLAQNIY